MTKVICSFLLMAVCGSAAATTIITPSYYPEHAMEKCIEGSVKVVYTVNEEGEAVNIKILESRPSGVFEQAAIQKVSSQSFQPRTVDGRVLAVEGVEQTLRFELDRESFPQCRESRIPQSLRAKNIIKA